VGKQRSFFEPWECKVEPRLHVVEGDAEFTTASPGPAIIWGEGMELDGSDYTESYLSPGLLLPNDRRGIVVKLRKIVVRPRGSPDHIEVARRIVQCVNFCQGVDLDSLPVGRLSDFLSDID
jgi:hypothetical protein